MPSKKRSKGSTSASANYDTIKFVSKAAADRKWENFAKQPRSSVPAVVYIFYANAYFLRDGAVYVIGKWVPISQTIINQYYGLQDIEEDGYPKYLENVDTDEVKLAICAFNTAWKTGRNGIPV
ncbi:hypothetical protein TIFTF001_030602 [Ficus carica]|uniref:Putative plant transposon protein domain-containing protein n=1 Tax=Ficus carica TaxID=3494 RepID=A0AA88DUK7_FICCA|nr:hypothetical protein TIFTF001_030602 [Ficus carica]